MKDIIRECFFCKDMCSDGIIINGEMICRRCEERIVNTPVEDINYEELKDDVKVMLFNE